MIIDLNKETKEILNSKRLRKFQNNYYYSILDIDLDQIIESFNNGEYDIFLDNKGTKNPSKINSETKELIKNYDITYDDINKIIYYLEKNSEKNKQFLEYIENLKNKMEYNPKTKFNIFMENSYTYEQALAAIEITNNFLNDKRIPKLIRFLKDNETEIYKLQEIIRCFDSIKNNGNQTKILKELLNQKDNNIGIIKYYKYDKNPEICAGTEKDIKLSEIINHPIYGRRMTFYEKGITEYHEKLINEEKQKRIKLMNNVSKENNSSSKEDLGYIYYNDCGIIISKEELMSYGIDPIAIGWKTLYIEQKQSFIKQLDKKLEKANIKVYKKIKSTFIK